MWLYNCTFGLVGFIVCFGLLELFSSVFFSYFLRTIIINLHCYDRWKWKLYIKNVRFNGCEGMSERGNCTLSRVGLLTEILWNVCVSHQDDKTEMNPFHSWNGRLTSFIVKKKEKRNVRYDSLIETIAGFACPSLFERSKYRR